MDEFVAAQAPGLDAVKLGENDPADFYMVRDGKLVGFAEVKCRTNRHDTYPTYMLSAHKLERLSQMADDHGVRAVVVVRWVDRLGVINVNRFMSGARYATGGRSDRCDTADTERVAHIQVGEFSFPTPR